MSDTIDSPIVRLVDGLLQKAILGKASDIHLEPIETGLRIRLRIDGLLHDHDAIDHGSSERVIARLKVLSEIDIAEQRIPQDGKIHISSDGKEIDLRVSTFPTARGEKIVVRILDRSTSIRTLESVGFSNAMHKNFIRMIERPHGFILISGPTGSGKTTTLYASLMHVNTPTVNIITLEDPIEYSIVGITQGQVHPQAGFTFERGMRAILRQDPDVIMLGEVRDRETAQVAIEASLTGHLVFSTVHANNATSVVTRLIEMGIEPFLLNASLTGVMAQRLARRICSRCRINRVPTDSEKRMLEMIGSTISTLFEGVGCQECQHRGYQGRIGIFELLPITDPIRSLLLTQPTPQEIVRLARTHGMKTLLEDGMAKVHAGVISLTELLRVIH